MFFRPLHACSCITDACSTACLKSSCFQTSCRKYLRNTLPNQIWLNKESRFQVTNTAPLPQQNAEEWTVWYLSALRGCCSCDRLVKQTEQQVEFSWKDKPDELWALVFFRRHFKMSPTHALKWANQSNNTVTDDQQKLETAAIGLMTAQFKCPNCHRAKLLTHLYRPKIILLSPILGMGLK